LALKSTASVERPLDKTFPRSYLAPQQRDDGAGTLGRRQDAQMRDDKSIEINVSAQKFEEPSR
jgi:hypothetical protein